jgi:hypothetical protein
VLALKLFHDRVMLMTRDDAVLELDLEGRVVRTISSFGSDTFVLGDDLVIPVVDGIELVGPSDATRGTIRLPGRVTQARADGKRIVALTDGDAGQRMVVWTDKVPDDPAALRTYLDSLTNARLPTGSDVLSWDP